jgi:hypothetical protein
MDSENAHLRVISNLNHEALQTKHQGISKWKHNDLITKDDAVSLEKQHNIIPCMQRRPFVGKRT